MFLPARENMWFFFFFFFFFFFYFFLFYFSPSSSNMEFHLSYNTTHPRPQPPNKKLTPRSKARRILESSTPPRLRHPASSPTSASARGGGGRRYPCAATRVQVPDNDRDGNGGDGDDSVPCSNVPSVAHSARGTPHPTQQRAASPRTSCRRRA